MESLQVGVATFILLTTGALVIWSAGNPDVKIDGGWWAVAVTAATYLFVAAGGRKRKRNGMNGDANE